MSELSKFINKVAILSEEFLKEAKKGKKKKDLPETSFIFPKEHPNVTKGDHFPIDTIGRARNALARANQYSKAPKWYKGSLQSLINAVRRAVKKRYPNIELTQKSKKPGKG